MYIKTYDYSYFCIFFRLFFRVNTFWFAIINFIKKKDPRNLGSKNIGATNIARINGWKLGLLTLILDILKSFIPVKICYIFYPDYLSLVSISVFLGHLFPFWLKFRGGKGVAAYLGIIFALSFKFGIIFSITWVLISFIFKYSSLASMIGALIVFAYSIILNNTTLSIFLFITFIIILYTHRENIVRLKDSKETKIKL